MSDLKPREFWISKGSSNFCQKLVPNEDFTQMVKDKPDGFYDIVSTEDTIEGGIHVIEKSAYDVIAMERDELKNHATESTLRLLNSVGIRIDMRAKIDQALELLREATTALEKLDRPENKEPRNNTEYIARETLTKIRESGLLKEEK